MSLNRYLKSTLAQVLQRVTAHCIGLFALLGCTQVPVENRPTIEVPLSFLEVNQSSSSQMGQKEELGKWNPANPSDVQKPSPWWSLFGNDELDRIQEEALKANPDVSIAMARLKQVYALSMRSESERFPELNAGFGATRQRTTGAAAGLGDGIPGSTQTLWRAQTSVAYELDIFGRVSSGVDAARADVAQQQALAHYSLLLVQAEVATTYFSLLQLESELSLLKETVKLRENASILLEQKFMAGAVARYVVDYAKTELLNVKSEQLALEQQHALVSHALATLLGKSPATYLFNEKSLTSITLRLPPGIPSTLLERRPDVAAAERAMIAENARIGVAEAAFFPSISLTGSLGYESEDLTNLANWSQRTFLLGPLVGAALTMPVIDGGRRKAEIAYAKAVYEQRIAEYRKTVLQAFKEVEDSLSSIRIIDERIFNEKAAEESSSRVAKAAETRFDNGDVDYLAVVEAKRTLLKNRQLLIQSQGARARATVQLVRALGGGWEASNTIQSNFNG